MEYRGQTRTASVNARLWSARAQDWADFQEGLCRPAYLAVFDQVGIEAGGRYLDVGCGAGMALHLAAERGALVAGLDVAINLLEIARSRVPSGNIHHGELEYLPFIDDTFDLVTGFNSFQFAEDPELALREARRVTKPGGHVVIVTWGNPEGMDAASLVAALRPLLPASPVGTPGPFFLSDEEVLRTFAAQADLAPQQVFDVDSPWYYPDLATALRGLTSAGVAVRAIEHSGEDAVINSYTSALAPFRQSDGSYKIGATFRCLTACA